MKILVGCPVSAREWILPEWKKHVEEAADVADVEVSYIFVVGDRDSGTQKLLSTWASTTILTTEEHQREDFRVWNTSRYEHMVQLRNQLLAEVRWREPELFLSLDSDILLHPQAIKSALKGFEEHPDAWAVGMKAYLVPVGKSHPNMGIWIDQMKTRYYRHDLEYCGRVDILMAAKLMKPEAYNIDYKWNALGEDLGWSASVAEAGGNLYWDGTVGNKHVMEPKWLDVVDERVGL